MNWKVAQSALLLPCLFLTHILSSIANISSWASHTKHAYSSPPLILTNSLSPLPWRNDASWQTFVIKSPVTVKRNLSLSFSLSPMTVYREKGHWWHLCVWVHARVHAHLRNMWWRDLERRRDEEESWKEETEEWRGGVGRGRYKQLSFCFNWVGTSQFKHTPSHLTPMALSISQIVLINISRAAKTQLGNRVGNIDRTWRCKLHNFRWLIGNFPRVQYVAILPHLQTPLNLALLEVIAIPNEPISSNG